VPKGAKAAEAGAAPRGPKTAKSKRDLDGAASTSGSPRTRPQSSATGKTKPYGREEVVESIIDATLSLWTAKGPAEISLRAIAARADVNYGLVYRHFRTKEAVIRAAMDQVVSRSRESVDPSTDLVDALDRVLPRSTGAHARLVAWGILQYLVDDILPADDVFLQRLAEIAGAGAPGSTPETDAAAKVRAGSLIAMLYGWRLFEPYLVRGLKLEDLPHAELDSLIRERMIKAITD
jgi:AcrR family transcriptional regulator